MLPVTTFAQQGNSLCKLLKPPTAADCSVSIFRRNAFSVNIAIDHLATFGFRYVKMTRLS